MEGGIDHRTTTSLAGLYLHTLEAIFLTSSSASGGSHRLLFETSNAASISSNPIPHRRIVPARLVNVASAFRDGAAYRRAPVRTRSLRFPQQPQKPLRRIRDRRTVPPAVPLAAGVKRGRDDYRSALALDVQSRPNLSRGVLPQDDHMGLPRKRDRKSTRR